MKSVLCKSHLFYKYLFYHFFILIIPLIFIIFLVFNYFSGILKESIIQSSQDTLIKVKNVIEMQLKEINNISFQISYNSELTPYMITKNSFKTKKGMDELRDYISTNNFIHNMFLYIRGSKYLYSPYSTYTIPNFINTIYNYKEWNIQDFTDTINSSKGPVLRPAEEVYVNTYVNNRSSRKLITYVVPIPSYSSNCYGTVLFQIKNESFRKLIENTLNGYDGNTIILDNADKVVTSFKDEDYIYSTEFENLIKFPHKIDSKTVSIEGKEYLFSYVKSKSSGWCYVTLIPIKIIMKKVSAIRTTTIIGLVILLLVSSIIIYHVSYIQYNPIRKLKNYTEKTWGEPIDSKNEINAIHLAIDHIANANVDLINIVESSKSALKDYLLLKLLKGHVYDIGGFNAKGKDIGITLTKPYFMVAIMHMHNIDKIKSFDKNKIISYIEEKLPADFEGYVKETVDEHLILLLMATSEEKNEIIKGHMDALRKSINKLWGMQITMGLGKQYCRPDEVGKSYLEALMSISYRFIKGNNKIICSRELSDQINNFDIFPNSKTNLLELSIKQGSTEKISEIIINIVESIQNNNMSIFAARCLCYDVINTALKTTGELNMKYCLNKNEYPDVISLMKLDTVEELKEVVQRICFDICKYVKQNKENGSFDLKNRITSYIKNNYHDSMLSIQAMAEYFGISSSYLSHSFKKQTGQTILNYVNYIRIEKAKELLAENNDSIKNVTFKIGYHDVSSFIRKFKKAAGITPGEFREINGKKYV